MNKALHAAIALLAALMLAACHPAAEKAPLAGASLGGPFSLVDQDGKPTTEARFAGRYRLVYFGYSFCPDVCPTDLQKIAQGYRLLAKSEPAKAAKLQPIFITVDPARDTPAVLKAYVAAFDPHLIGLTGSEAEIKRVASAYGAYFSKQPPAPGQRDYLVDHSRTATLYGPEGKPIALIAQDGAPAEIARELSRWIR